MEIQNYIQQFQTIQNALIEFIDEEVNVEEYYQNLIQVINDNYLQQDQHKLTEFLRLLSAISCNHSRTPYFFKRIERIIIYFESEIKDYYSNTEIFNFFKKNKRILLFLSERKIITSIIELIKSIPNEIKRNDYLQYFIFNKYIKISKKNKELNLTDFENNQKKGENDDFVCQLIQRDGIDEFISYVNKKGFSLRTQIEYSIFETNTLLIFDNPNLIEYSAFFGSVQIFKYLYLNGVELTESLWIYAIHGRNPEIIHILEEKHIKPEDVTFQECLIESIKCHHNEIADYILNNYLQNDEIDDYCHIQSIFYSNYAFLPNQLDNLFIIYHLCKYSYEKIVEILFKKTDIKINDLVISKKIFFF